MRRVFGHRIMLDKQNRLNLNLCKEVSPKDFPVILNYEARLSGLGLQSLEMRRLKYDLLYTYKIVFGLVSDAAMHMFTLTNSYT